MKQLLNTIKGFFEANVQTCVRIVDMGLRRQVLPSTQDLVATGQSDRRIQVPRRVSLLLSTLPQLASVLHIWNVDSYT